MSELIGKFLLIVIAYIVSTIAMHNWVRIAYSKGGVESHVKADAFCLWITFTPGINSIFAIVMWIFEAPYRKAEKEWNLERFFNIKRDNDDCKN